MKFQKLYFNNQQGQQLGARLDLPVDQHPLAYALFAHCFTCTKNLKAVSNISQALTTEGIAVLRFDFTGLGESEGDFADTNFSSNVADLVAAADFLRAEHQAPQLLIGHSLGGAAVLQAAGQIDEAKAVVTLGAPCSPEHVTRLLESRRQEIETQGEANVTLAGRQFKIKKQFLDDLEEQTMQETIKKLRRALLIMHAPLDNTVGIENAAHIFQAAKHPKSFVSLDQADHLLSKEADSLFAGSVMATWAKKYLDLPARTEEMTKEADNLTVVRIAKQKYTCEIRTNGHGLTADEPATVGGANLGPSPYELLLSSLGACTAMTIRMYADRKKWPLDEAIVRLKHEKIHAKDCEDCESKSGKIDYIDRVIELIGDLDEEQRQRLLEIADRCPVHRTLHSEIVVKSRLQ